LLQAVSFMQVLAPYGVSFGEYLVLLVTAAIGGTGLKSFPTNYPAGEWPGCARSSKAM
jgi:hypothetical protein